MDIQTQLEAALQDAQAGRFSEAEAKLVASLQPQLSDNDTATIQGILGAVYASMGDHAAGARELARAAAVNLDDASIQSNLCNCLTQTGALNEAIAAGSAATGINPGFVEAHNNPDYAAAHYNLADVYRGSGDLDNALALCKRALQLGPYRAEAHQNMAVVLRDRVETEKALASFRRALDIAPGDEEAVKGIGEVLMEVGRYAEGLEALANTFGVIRFEAGAGVSV